MWFLIAAFVVGLFATLLLGPKAKTTNAEAGKFSDLNFPKSNEGDPVIWFIGKVRNKGPNTLWAGDFEARPIKKKQKTGLFSSKKVIVGYEYLVGLVLGLGLGPDVTLHRIWSGKDEIWSGTANADATALAIDKPNLYGGKEKGGGFSGTIRFYTGSFTQPINAYYETNRAADVPAYRGTALAVLEHCNIGEQNSLRELSFEQSRYPNDLGIPAGKHIVGEDANPMEALYQAFISDWGGLNVNPSMLDTDSMVDCALTLYDEGNGYSIKVSNPKQGKDVASDILKQVDAIMYNDPTTGKIIVKLIRDDFGAIEDLPVFDESNILAVRSFSRTLWEDTINLVRINYTNRDNKYENGTAMQDDMSNIGAQGRLRPITNLYEGCNVGSLANQLAARDIGQGSVPLMSAQIETNREGAGLRPGDRFVWGWDEYRIQQAVMRVKNFDLGSLNDNRIVMNIVQDEFAISDTLIADPVSEGSSLSQPDTPATDVANWVVKEAPYFFAVAAGLSVGNLQSVILVAADAPANADQFDVYASNDAGANYDPSEEGVVFNEVGTLATAITSTGSLSTGVLASINVTMDPSLVDQNTAADAAKGSGMFLIGNEIFVYETKTDGSGVVTLNNVWRSLLDTSPAAHNIGDEVYFLSGDSIVDDLFSYTDALRVKLLPATFNDKLDIAAATYKALTLNKRCSRPLPPAAIKFGAGAFFAPPANGTTPQTLTWANRDRTSETIRKIVDTTNEYEANQQTVIRWRKNAGAWTTLTYGPSVNTATIATGSVSGDTIDWEVYAAIDGLESYAKWTFTSAAANAGSSSPETGGADPADTTTPYVAPEDSVSIVFPFGETIGTYQIDIPITFAITIPAGLTGSNVDHDVNPAATATFTLKKNGTSVGTIAISTAGAYTLTAASAISLVAGDSFACVPPAVADGSLVGVTITIAGTRVKVI